MWASSRAPHLLHAAAERVPQQLVGEAVPGQLMGQGGVQVLESLQHLAVAVLAIRQEHLAKGTIRGRVMEHTCES